MEGNPGVGKVDVPTEIGAESNLAFGEFLIDRADERLIGPNGPVKLGHKAFELLLRLAEHKGRLVTKDSLLSTVWDGTTVSESSLTTAVRELRRALGDESRTPSYIESVYGRGYRLLVPVSEVAPAAPAGAMPQPRAAPEGRLPVRPASAGQARLATPPVPTARRRFTAALLLVFVLLLGGLAYWLTAPDSRASASRSVAVLPFVNLGGAAEGEHLGDGMAEELISALSRVEGLKVAARGSTFRFRGGDADPKRLGELLGVATVVEGSVSTGPERLRVSARLVGTQDGYALWAQTFEGRPGDLFAIQRQIARGVAEALGMQSHGTGGGPVFSAARHLPAYKEYLRGRYYWSRRNGPSLNKALEHFQKALEHDPAYAEAYAGLADAYLLLPVHASVPASEAYPRAKAAALRALDLSPDLPEAFTSLGYVHFWYEWDYAAAERAFRRATAIDPNYATAHHWLSELLLTTGRTEQAIASANRAETLDPLSPQIRTDSAANFFYARRYPQAVERLRTVLTLDPAFFVARWYLGIALLEQAQTDAAIAELDRARELSRGSDWSRGWLAVALARGGQREQASAIMRRLEAEAQHRHVRSEIFGYVRLALGDRDGALRAFGAAIEERAVFPFMMARHPQLDPLRGDPRFQELLRRMNLAGEFAGLGSGRRL